MRLYLNAGFGQVLGKPLLEEIRARGYAGVRQDIPSAESCPTLCEEIARVGLQPILLVGGGKMGVGGRGTPPEESAALALHTAKAAQSVGLFDGESPAAVEIGNEPDIAFTYDRDPALFSRLVRLAHDRIREVSSAAQIVTGGIASTDRRGLDYLAKALGYGLPDDCIIGYHTYRTTKAPEEPHKGFKTRDDEFKRLKALAGRRQVWCTEAGWHTAPSKVRWGPFGLFRRRLQYTDQQVADFAAREVRLNARHAALGFVWFQLNDGPDPNQYEHRFGIRSLSGAWKPVADTLASLGREVSDLNGRGDRRQGV